MSYMGNVQIPSNIPATNRNRITILNNGEIIDFILELGIQFSVEGLEKPSPECIQFIFGSTIKKLSDPTHGVQVSSMLVAPEDVFGEETSVLFPAYTMASVVSFETLRRLLLTCGITDPSPSDLYQPTHERLVRIFSHLIHFIRFCQRSFTATNKPSKFLKHTSIGTNAPFLKDVGKTNELEDAWDNRNDPNQALGNQKNHCTKDGDYLEVLATIRSLELKEAEVVGAEQSQHQKQQVEPRLGSALAGSISKAKPMKRPNTTPRVSTTSIKSPSNDSTKLTKLLSDACNKSREEVKKASKGAGLDKGLWVRLDDLRKLTVRKERLQSQLANLQENLLQEKCRADEQRKYANARKMKLIEEKKILLGEQGARKDERATREMRVIPVEEKIADLREQIDRDAQNGQHDFEEMESHILLYIEEMELKLVHPDSVWSD